MSERLTYQTDINEHELKCCLCTATIDGEPIPKECDGKEVHFCSEVSKSIEKLGHYEDMEEAGRLIELPCKIGDPVYFIRPCLVKCEDHKCFTRFYDCYENVRIMKAKFTLSRYERCEFGKTIFLTRKDAEAKLKEMSSSENRTSELRGEQE